MRPVCQLGLEVVFEVLLRGFNLFRFLLLSFNPVLIILLDDLFGLRQFLFDAFFQLSSTFLFDLVQHQNRL